MSSDRGGFAVTFGLLLLVATAALGEVLVRVWNPPPRRMKVQLSRFAEVRDAGGVPLWFPAFPDEPDRLAVLEGRDCVDDDDAFRVLMLGDSIFHGIDVPVARVSSERLEDLLESRHPGLQVCVVNLAIPGYSMYQAVARGREFWREHDADLVVLELWGGAPREVTVFGDRAYFFEDLPLDGTGLANPMGLPAPLHLRLFTNSRLYEYAVLAWPEVCGGCRHDLEPHRALLDEVLASAPPGELVTVMPAQLFSPFDDQPEAIFLENAGFEDWIAEHGLRNVRMWEALAGRDPAGLRLDGCHLNPAGNDALATVLAELAAPDVEAFLAR